MFAVVAGVCDGAEAEISCSSSRCARSVRAAGMGSPVFTGVVDVAIAEWPAAERRISMSFGGRAVIWGRLRGGVGDLGSVVYGWVRNEVLVVDAESGDLATARWSCCSKALLERRIYVMSLTSFRRLSLPWWSGDVNEVGVGSDRLSKPRVSPKCDITPTTTTAYCSRTTNII